MKLIYVLPFLFLISCGESNSTDSGTQTFEASDTIKEFDMNENRLSAVEFNNELTLMQERTLDLIDELFQSDSTNVDLNLGNALFELEINIIDINDIHTKYQMDELAIEYRKAQLDLMYFYSGELKSGFSELVPLIKQKELSKKEKDELTNYDIYFAEQEKIWFDSIFIAQDKFAKANNIKLQE